MIKVLQFGGVITAALGALVWFLRWRLRRAKDKNGVLVIENETLRKVLKLNDKLQKRMEDAKISRQKSLPRDGVVDPSKPWDELRERDKKR